jgi:hypothetical protein
MVSEGVAATSEFLETGLARLRAEAFAQGGPGRKKLSARRSSTRRGPAGPKQCVGAVQCVSGSLARISRMNQWTDGMDGWKSLTKSSPSSTHRGTLTAKQPVPEHFSKTSRRFRGHLTTSRNGCEKFSGLGE